MSAFAGVLLGLGVVFWLMSLLGVEGLGKVCWSGITLLAVAASLAATAPG